MNNVESASQDGKKSIFEQSLWFVKWLENFQTQENEKTKRCGATLPKVSTCQIKTKKVAGKLLLNCRMKLHRKLMCKVWFCLFMDWLGMRNYRCSYR